MTFASFAGLVVRHRRPIIVVWVVIAAALTVLARGVEHRLDTGARVPESESAHVAALLSERFRSPFASYAVAVVRGVPAPTTSDGRTALGEIVAALRRSDRVAGTLSALDVPDTLFTPRSGGTFVVVGLRPGGARMDSAVAALRDVTRRLLPALRARHPAAELSWTGEAPLTVDLRELSARDARRAERRVLPVTLALLVVAFGAFAAAMIPVAAGAAAIAVTLGSIALLARVLPVSVLALNVTTMLGLGLGIDYALLLVTRFREARARGLDGEHAAREAAEFAGRTVVLSGVAVLVGYLALLLAPLSDLRSIGVAGAIVTAVSVLIATTLLPGVLAVLGARTEWGTWRRAPRRIAAADVWRRWSGVVVRHPGRVLLLAGAPILALVWQSRRFQAHTPSSHWLPPSIESARALRQLESMQRSGIAHSVRVVVQLPAGVQARTPAASRLLARLVGQLQSRPDVARLTVSGISSDNRLVLLDLLPAQRESGEHSVASAMALVRQLRALRAWRASTDTGARLYVGGLPAFNVDYGDAVVRATPRVVVLVVLGTLIGLGVGFRSVLIPIKAVALNLVAVGAAFGAVTLVFLDGHGMRAIGLAQPLDGIFPAVPLLVFCTVFGLSMDYEVFLVSRVAEARRAGADESRAVVEGVSRTGRVITSAALVMIVVFGAFTMGEFVLMKILGFALAVAVLLDVTIIRLALGPALLRLAGRWNWWPLEGRPAGARLSTSGRPHRRTRASSSPALP